MRIKVQQRENEAFGVRVIRPSDPEFKQAARECLPPRCTKSDPPKPMWFEAMRRGRG